MISTIVIRNFFSVKPVRSCTGLSIQSTWEYSVVSSCLPWIDDEVTVVEDLCRGTEIESRKNNLKEGRNNKEEEGDQEKEN